MPSSCHLSNFLDLKGKEVMLIPNKSKETMTQFSVFAVPYNKNYAIEHSALPETIQMDYSEYGGSGKRYFECNTIENRADGRIQIKSSAKKNQTTIMTPDSLCWYMGY